MKAILKSRLYQTEILRWVVTVTLTCWASLATFFALRNTQETIVIALAANGSARLITAEDEKFVQGELTQFLKAFLDAYYNYDPSNFEERLGQATDLMSKDLWEREQPKVMNIASKMKDAVVIQAARIKNVDLIEDGRVEALLEILLKQRVNEVTTNLKVNLKYEKRARSKENPWGYEITEVSDVAL